MTKTSLLLLVDFWFPSLVGRVKDKIDEKRLSNWKLLDNFRRRLVNAQTTLSEAQGVFDPELLKQVFLLLGGEIPTSWGDARLAHLADKLKLVDGTLLPALPRMHWALWLNEQNRAAKLHLKFTVLRQAPSDALITHGNSCERKALREFMKKGETIVGDRYYGLEYGFLEELRQLGVCLYSASATSRAWKSWRNLR